jgi:hypothetical protein
MIAAFRLGYAVTLPSIPHKQRWRGKEGYGRHLEAAATTTTITDADRIDVEFCKSELIASTPCTV